MYIILTMTVCSLILILTVLVLLLENTDNMGYVVLTIFIICISAIETSILLSIITL
jgi:hypothetical protein